MNASNYIAQNGPTQEDDPSSQTFDLQLCVVANN
jgi:hypothetical protein